MTTKEKLCKKERKRCATSVVYREGVVFGYKKAYREMKGILKDKWLDYLLEVLEKCKF